MSEITDARDKHQKELARTLAYLAGLSSMKRPDGWDAIEKQALLAGAAALSNEQAAPQHIGEAYVAGIAQGRKDAANVTRRCAPGFHRYQQPWTDSTPCDYCGLPHGEPDPPPVERAKP